MDPDVRSPKKGCWTQSLTHVDVGPGKWYSFSYNNRKTVLDILWSCARTTGCQCRVVIIVTGIPSTNHKDSARPSAGAVLTENLHMFSLNFSHSGWQWFSITFSIIQNSYRNIVALRVSDLKSRRKDKLIDGSEILVLFLYVSDSFLRCMNTPAWLSNCCIRTP